MSSVAFTNQPLVLVPFLPLSKRFKSQLQPVLQFSLVAFLSRGVAPTYHCRNLSPNVLPSSVQLSNMDNSSRQRLPAPSNQTTNLRQLPEPGTSSATIFPEEVHGRVDQVALVQNTLRTEDTPHPHLQICNTFAVPCL